MRCAFRAVEVQPQEVHDGVRERPNHVLRAQGHKSACSQINDRRSGLPTHPDSPLHAHPSSGKTGLARARHVQGSCRGFRTSVPTDICCGTLPARLMGET